jgi:hypothetical protein
MLRQRFQLKRLQLKIQTLTRSQMDRAVSNAEHTAQDDCVVQEDETRRQQVGIEEHAILQGASGRTRSRMIVLE